MQVDGQEGQIENAGIGEAAGHDGGEGVSPQEGEAPYEPNYSFRVMDEQREFDEWIRPLIKDKDTEAKFRDLHERAMGLDHVKTDRSTLRGENSSLKQEVGQYKEFVGNLSNFRQQAEETGNWDTYLEAVNIPPLAILRQAQKIIQLQDDPSRAASYQNERAQYWQNHELQQQQANLQQQMASMREQQVDMVLGNPTYNELVQQFDARMGPGAFKNEVIKQGQYHWMSTKQDLGVMDAVQNVLKLAGFSPNSMQPGANAFNQPQQMAGFNNPGQGQPQTFQGAYGGQPQMPAQPVAQARPPVLPNISGTGGSVVKAVPRSIDDLKKIRAGM